LWLSRINAFDLSTHLHHNSYYETDVAAAAVTRVGHSNNLVADARSIKGYDSHPEEGDLFMYDDEHYDSAESENNSCADSLGKPHTHSSRGSKSSSHKNYDDGNASLGSASFNCYFSDSADTISDEDSDTSLNGYEFYEEKCFPSGVDNVVHVGLPDLCLRMKVPLYTMTSCIRHNKILKYKVTPFLLMLHTSPLSLLY
jgi:hypothetical protein